MRLRERRLRHSERRGMSMGDVQSSLLIALVLRWVCDEAYCEGAGASACMRAAVQ